MGDKASATLTWGVRLDPSKLSKEKREEFEKDPDGWIAGKLGADSKLKLYLGGCADVPDYVLGHKDRTTETDWRSPKEVDPRTHGNIPFELGQALTTLGLGQPIGRWYLLAYWG